VAACFVLDNVTQDTLNSIFTIIVQQLYGQESPQSFLFLKKENEAVE
jgi:hypothetical protein